MGLLLNLILFCTYLLAGYSWPVLPRSVSGERLGGGAEFLQGSRFVQTSGRERTCTGTAQSGSLL